MQLDVEDTGAIPLRRVQDLVRRIDVSPELDEQEKLDLVMKADLNQDGYIDRGEFVKLVSEVSSSDFLGAIIAQ